MNVKWPSPFCPNRKFTTGVCLPGKMRPFLNSALSLIYSKAPQESSGVSPSVRRREAVPSSCWSLCWFGAGLKHCFSTRDLCLFREMPCRAGPG